MLADYRHTSMSLGTHPLALLRPHLPEGTLSSAELHAERHGRQVAFAGMTVARQRPSTAKGIVFMLLEDEHGQVNLIVPSEVYERHRATVRAEPLDPRPRPLRAGGGEPERPRLEARVARPARAASREGRHRVGVAPAAALLRPPLRLRAPMLAWCPRCASLAAATIDVAYRVVGDGPVDLVCVEGAYTHLEIAWELPAYRRYYERIGEFARVILFDKRGLGMSDRVPGATTLEERMDDIGAVMDAVGSERAAVLGESEGGPLSILFAAAHPERTVALDPAGRGGSRANGRGLAVGRGDDEEFEEYLASHPRSAGARGLACRSSSRASETSVGLARGSGGCRCMRRRPRRGRRSPRMAFGIDVRDIVPDDRRPDADPPRGRRSGLPRRERPLPRSARSADAKYVELPGGDHVPWFDPDETVARDPRVPHGQRETRTSEPRARDGALHRSRRLDRARRRARGSPLARPPRAAPRVGAARAHAFRRTGGRHRGRRLLRDVRRSGAGRSAARRRSSKRFGPWASTSAPVCTRARSSSRTARSRASPSTSARALRRGQTRARCSSPAP